MLNQPTTQPDRFPIFPWQEKIFKQLINLKNQQQLPHAILLENRSGSDCSRLGWYLVQGLLCDSTSDSAPCGSCNSCNLMQSQSYPDFTYTSVIEDEKTHKLNKFIRIDQIRKLIHQISLTDNRGKGKYALIYPAERLHISAANSLLKTLEEPPEGSTLILLSHNPGKLPITIRSRCQKWVFDRPDITQAEQWLKSQGVDTEQATKYIEMAQQDVELALRLHQQNYAEYQAEFSLSLKKFMDNQMAVTTLANQLVSFDSDLMKLLLKHEMNKVILKNANKNQTSHSKLILNSLLELYKSLEKSLNIEENNLNLRLLVEDMLISLKQILSRG